MDYLPLFLRIKNQPVVVIGGGEVAARKTLLLTRAGAAVTLIAPTLCASLQARLAKREITHRAEAFRPEHLDGARLVVAATDSRETNAWVSRTAEERNIPVNVVDDRELSRFIMPAIVDRSPVMVAIGSSGDAPVLTRRLREKIEALLPASLGKLAKLSGEVRGKVKQRVGNADARRRFWERFFDGDIAADVLAGREGHAQQSIQQAIDTSLQQETGAAPVGEVALVGAGPGDPGLLTLRALRVMQNADVVVYDRLVSDEVLDLVRRDAERIYVGKEACKAYVAQEDINQLLVDLAQQGKRVCRLKGGDPFVFGRGGEELEKLATHGIRFEVVPGISAAAGCAAYAGIPLTHRDYAQVLSFTTGHAKNDVASDNGTAALDWSTLARAGQTVVFYMGLVGLSRIMTQLQLHGLPAKHPAAVIEHGTRPGQRVITGTLATLAEQVQHAAVRSPALLIVGEVTTLHERLKWFNTTAIQAQTDEQDMKAGLN
jgi:uroporphyrin-III C-methyltransferase / precorrin-2 dehydrogenase / sirohydrochlorin ferrochelatase